MRHVLAQCRRQIVLVLLLLRNDLPNLLRQRVMPDRLRLPQPLPVLPERLRLVLQVEPQHLLRLVRQLHRLGRRIRHRAQIVNLIGDGHRVRQFLARMLPQLSRNVHPLRALQYVAVDRVGNDRLILARQILLQPVDQLLQGTAVLIFCHFSLLNPVGRPTS